MSGSDRELVERVVALFNRMLELDEDAFRVESARVWADEPEIVPLRAALEGQSFRGPDAVAEFRAASLDAWSELGLELQAVEGEGPRYLCSGVLRGRGRGSGAEFRAPIWIVIDVAHDRVARVATHLERDRALAEAGTDS